MGIDTSGSWDTDDDEPIAAPTTTAESGDAPVMDVWSRPREQLLNDLINVQFTNAAEFEIPNAVIDTGGFNTSWQEGEKNHGVNVTAGAFNPDGKPLSGTAKISASGYVFREATVSGKFILSALPPLGVSTGPNVEGDQYDFSFEPSVNGIAVLNENIDYDHAPGTIQYGSVGGTVETLAGDPASNVAVAGPAASDITDGAGAYQLLGPGGTTFTLSTFYGTYETDISMTAGESKTVDFVFPTLTIKVLDADLQPIEGAPVNIDGSTFETGENGKVEIEQAEVKPDYSVTVQNYFSADDIGVSEAGQEFVYTVGPGASFGDYSNLSVGGVKIKATDKATGRGIRSLRTRDALSGVESLSTGDGVCKIVNDQTGEDIELRIGTGDKRYRTQTVTGTMPDGDMIEFTVELEPKTAVTNS